jgi:hypothetical protein
VAGVGQADLLEFNHGVLRRMGAFLGVASGDFESALSKTERLLCHVLMSKTDMRLADSAHMRATSQCTLKCPQHSQFLIGQRDVTP